MPISLCAIFREDERYVSAVSALCDFSCPWFYVDVCCHLRIQKVMCPRQCAMIVDKCKAIHTREPRIKLCLRFLGRVTVSQAHGPVFGCGEWGGLPRAYRAWHAARTWDTSVHHYCLHAVHACLYVLSERVQPPQQVCRGRLCKMLLDCAAQSQN